MNKERLLAIANNLDDVPDEAFNMLSWDCCAIGWAARNEALPEIYFDGGDLYFLGTDEEIDFENLAEYLDITRDQATELFGVSELVTPVDVQARLMEFINGDVRRPVA